MRNMTHTVAKPADHETGDPRAFRDKFWSRISKDDVKLLSDESLPRCAAFSEKAA
jgi:hypothetical protein